MNNSQFSLANRKQLADLLGRDYNSIREKAKSALREKRQALTDSLMHEQAEKTGALKLRAQIKAANDKVNELEEALTKLGFTIDDDDVRLYGRASAHARKSIDEQVDKTLGTQNDIDSRFDQAQIDIMTAATLDEARQILKTVSEK